MSKSRFAKPWADALAGLFVRVFGGPLSRWPALRLLARRGHTVDSAGYAPLRWARLAVLALFLLLLGHALAPLLGPLSGLFDNPVLRQFDRTIYDQQLRALAPRDADPHIVVVDIDERSLAAHGRWPWDRALLADLLAQIAGPGGARLVGLDLVLAEPERRPAHAAPALARSATPAAGPLSDGDQRLAEVLRKYPVVLGFHLSNEAGAARIGQLPPALAPSALLPAQSKTLVRWAGHGGNLPALQAAARLGAGHLNATIDSDGLVRRLPLLVEHDGGVHGALALVMARAALGGRLPSGLAGITVQPADAALKSIELRAPPGGGKGLAPDPATAPAWPAGALRFPVDAHGFVLVPYHHDGTGFVRLSAADVLAGRVATDTLQGKVVLVGVSAPGLIDQRATPVDEAMPGTLVHANLLSAMLSQRMLALPAASPLIEAGTLLLLGALLWAALPRLGLWQGVLLTAGVLLALLAGHTVAWLAAGKVLPLGSSLLLPLAMLGLRSVQAYGAATGARRHLAGLFGQYVPPELVDQMSLQPERYTMRSRSAELTVLFADVHGFSGVAQHMAPAELGAMMNLIFSHLTDVIRAHRGTLDKYIGDSVMAFWGAPLDDADHAERAVAAALAMHERLPRLHAELAHNGWPPLGIHIGINTGIMVVGDMGSRHRRAYTVMGDAVNLAARLQALCSQHALGLVIGEATRKALGERLCLALGDVPVRGRAAPIPVWHPLPWLAGKDRHADHFCQAWDRMRKAVDDGQLDRAHRMLDALQNNLALQTLCLWQRRRLVGGQGPDSTLPAPG